MTTTTDAGSAAAMSRDRPPEGSTVAEYIVDQLISSSIDVVYGVHGANVEDLYDAAARDTRMVPVVAKHEFAAGAMADGAARLTGRPAAVLTTSGGGALNVLPALGEAYDSRVPVLALIGTAPTTAVGHGGFQDMLSPPDTIDLADTLSGIVGSCSVVARAEQVPAAMARAFTTLRRGRPAAVLVPKDVQSSRLTRADHGVHQQHSSVAPVDSAGLQMVAERLCAAVVSGGRVCLWAGEEASVAGVGDRLDRLAGLLGAVIVATPGGRDVLCDAPGHAGITGVMGHPSAHRAIDDATLILSVGARMSATDRGGLDDILRDRDVVHVGVHPPRAPGLTEHLEVGDLADALDAITEYVARQHLVVSRRPDVEIDRLPVPAAVSAPAMRCVIEEIGSVLPVGTTVFADAGNAGAAAIHHLPFGRGRFVVALGMGGMGYAVAAGVGNAIRTAAHGDRARTVVIAGDGAFFMHGMELHTAVEYGAPVTVVILNNDAHGMCVTRERLFFPNTPSINRFQRSDIAAGLDAMFPGLRVAHAVDPGQTRGAMHDLLSHPGPSCLVVDVDPDEIPPFAPFLPKGSS